MTLLELSQLRYLTHHRLQTLLAILGIALGVAVVNAVDITNYSARQNLRNSVQQLDSLASHKILGADTTINEAHYAELRRQLLSRYPELKLAPVINGFLYSHHLDNSANPTNKKSDKNNTDSSKPKRQKWQLLGIDPLSGDLFKGLNSNPGSIEFNRFITQDNAVLITRALAKKYQLAIGDTLKLPLINKKLSGQHSNQHANQLLDHKHSQSTSLLVAGIIENTNLSLLIMDIGHAQSLLSKHALLSSIEVSIPKNQPELIAIIQSILPSQLQLLSKQQLIKGQLSLISALEFNLSALSLLAVVVGTFLIFSTIRFSVLQRTPTFARLRVLGVSNQELQWLLLKEALLLATLGIVIGWILGFLLSQLLAPITHRTISDLYSSQAPATISYHWKLYGKTAVLGLLATLFTSQLCYRNLQQLALSHTMSRVRQEADNHQHAYWQLITAALFGLIGLLLLSPGINQNLNQYYLLLSAYVAVFLLVASALLLLPFCVSIAYPALQTISHKLFGTTGLIALRDCRRESSRVLLAIMALCLAVAATNGIATMVDSFRSSVSQWIEAQLSADIYLESNNVQPHHRRISKPLLNQLKNHPDIDHLFIGRMTRTRVDNKWLPLNAVENTGEKINTAIEFIAGNLNDALQNFHQGQLLISEPLARKKQLGVGDTLTLHTGKGLVDFTIAGVIRSYDGEHGSIVIHRQHYQNLWQDNQIDKIGLFLKDSHQKQRVLSTFENTLAKTYSLRLTDALVIKNAVFTVFDRTFAITQVLQFLVLIIAVIAIISTLMMYQLQRREQLLTLRALGMTITELRKLFIIQACFIGGMAGLLAIPLGLLLAWLLVHIINPAAFGWTLSFHIDPIISLTGFSVALLAGLLSAIYPCLHFGKAANITELNRE